MLPELESHRIEWDAGRSVAARIRPAVSNGDAGDMMVLAHGAGTNQDHPGVTELRDALAGVGLTVVTFNYPYTEAGRKAPDRALRLLDCHRAVIRWVGARTGAPVVLAGRSMGGRMASMLAAEGEPCSALIVYGYPLHPAGKPDRLRIEHLPVIKTPTLFFQGDRDALSRPGLFDRHIRRLPGVSVVDVPGADHSFRVPGKDRSEVMQLLADRTRAFLEGAFGSRPASKA